MPPADTINIRPTAETDRDWMRAEMRKWWGSELVVVRGERYYPAEMNGFIAEKVHERMWLIILRVDKRSCEIMSLTTTGDVPGLGKRLIDRAIKDLRPKGIKHLSLVTTNDNIQALRFYQSQGFIISDWRRNALEISRKLKPEIPLIGNYNIPIRDEIELEMTI